MSNSKPVNKVEDVLDYDPMVRFRPSGNKSSGMDAGDIFSEIRGGQVLTYKDVLSSGENPVIKFDSSATYPGPYNVHVTQALSDLALKWELEEKVLINPKVAPVYEVDHLTNTYYKVGEQGADLLRTPGDTTDSAAIGAGANEVDLDFQTDVYTCQQHAVRSFLPDAEVQNADKALELLQSRTRFLTQFIEYRVDARLLLNTLTTANFTNDTFGTLAGSSVHVTDATQSARYISNVLNAAKVAVNNQNAMRMPNVLLTDANTALAISASPEVAQQIVYSMGSQYVEQGGMSKSNAGDYGLPPVYSGLKVVVAPHVENTAKKGQTPAFSSVLPSTGNIILLYVDQPSLQTLNTVTIFRKGGIKVRSWYDFVREGTWIETSVMYDPHVTNQFGGYVITHCLS